MRGDRKREVWNIFAPHHYLSHTINLSSDCWVLKWGNALVGFCAVRTFPSGTMNYAKSIHRLVILPDFQGMKLGTRFMETLAEIYLKRGYKVHIRTAHERLGDHMEASALWRATGRNGKTGAISNGAINGKNQNMYIVNSVRYSYEYMGEEWANKPHIEFAVDSLDDIDVDALRSLLVELKRKNHLTIVHNKVQGDSWLNAMCRELGIRTELLYSKSHGKFSISKKRKGMKLLMELKKGKKPVYGIV